MYPMPDYRDRLETDRRDVRTRVVVDGQGNEWAVHEVETPQPWAHGERCLIFSSSSIVRRIWSFPRNWNEMSSAQLLELVGEVVPPR